MSLTHEQPQTIRNFLQEAHEAVMRVSTLIDCAATVEIVAPLADISAICDAIEESANCRVEYLN